MGQFRFLTAGESHGKALTVIIEGMPADLPLSEEDIAEELKRRQAGYGRGNRMRIEQDRAEILSGVRHGFTIGSPLALTISNRDWENWQEVMSISPTVTQIPPLTRPRPGHADLAGVVKYGLRDIRPIIERSSARDTAARVAVGAVARRFLEEFNIETNSHTLAIGGHWAKNQFPLDWEVIENSPVRCADTEVEKAMIAAIDEAKKNGDTLGGVFEIIATGLPIGLGSYVHWDRRLDGQLAQAIMSINAVKGVEIGLGFALADLRGSQAHDVIQLREGKPSPTEGIPPWRRATNRAGGIEGGISNGEPLVIRAAVKPISTLAKPLKSVDLHSGEVVEAHFERSDICVVPAAGVIGEAMVAIVLTQAILEKFGGDNLKETLNNYQAYLANLQKFGNL
jgi:chorismate synthase